MGNQKIRITSPCNGTCNLVGKICTGCKRSIEEITKWLAMSNEEREAIEERIKNSL